MNKKFILLLLLFSQFVLCQHLKLAVIKSGLIKLDADSFIGFDGFNNCFYTKNNILYKKVDTTLLQYQNLGLGKISSVDILNPLKVVLFYEEFNSVIILDNQLNEIQKIEFSKLETPILASAIGMSGQNKLWVFNSLNQQIGLFDLSLNQLQIIGNPLKDGMNFYQTNFNYFQFIDKNNLWNTYTIFGRFFQSGTVEEHTQIQFVDDKKYFFVANEVLFLKDVTSNKIYEIEIVEKSFKKFYYKDQILSIFTNEGIMNYKITLP